MNLHVGFNKKIYTLLQTILLGGVRWLIKINTDAAVLGIDGRVTAGGPARDHTGCSAWRLLQRIMSISARPSIVAFPYARREANQEADLVAKLSLYETPGYFKSIFIIKLIFN